MARGGHITLTLDMKDFERYLQASLVKVERGTKKATIAACEDIKQRTLKQVPRDTETLAQTFFYEVEGRYRNFTATIGYGGPKDRPNPRTGQMASEYMLQVHEDLEAKHPIGKAKFLEDPLREYQMEFAGKSAVIIRNELERG